MSHAMSDIFHAASGVTLHSLSLGIRSLVCLLALCWGAWVLIAPLKHMLLPDHQYDLGDIGIRLLRVLLSVSLWLHVVWVA